VVRSTAQVAAGDRVITRLSDGVFTSRVEAAAPNNRATNKKAKK
jgi:hypothetical protein